MFRERRENVVVIVIVMSELIRGEMGERRRNRKIQNRMRQTTTIKQISP